jgi:ribosomal protein S18 acetylase RimI-like enzyme
MDILLRTYRPDDLERIKAITVEGFDGVSIDRNLEDRHGRFGPHDWKWRKERHIDQDVARDQHGVFVAEVDGQVVGYITTWLDHESGIGNIPNLAVSSTHRGAGIGRRLIEHALDHFRASGMSYARIETLEQNRIGQKLYPACGFEEVARQIHYGMPLAAKPAPATPARVEARE